jgi:tripartite-type tricarboxylate transporter receptor subunit TctC
VKILANAGSKRQAVIPGVPTLAEQGVQNAGAIVWFGAATPAKTPRAVIEKLNREINRALALADVKSRLAQLGLEVGGGTPEDFERFIRKEASRLTALIKAGAIKVE